MTRNTCLRSLIYNRWIQRSRRIPPRIIRIRRFLDEFTELSLIFHFIGAKVPNLRTLPNVLVNVHPSRTIENNSLSLEEEKKNFQNHKNEGLLKVFPNQRILSSLLFHWPKRIGSRGVHESPVLCAGLFPRTMRSCSLPTVGSSSFWKPAFNHSDASSYSSYSSSSFSSSPSPLVQMLGSRNQWSVRVESRAQTSFKLHRPAIWMRKHARMQNGPPKRTTWSSTSA